jgi:hypothetical protein
MQHILAVGYSFSPAFILVEVGGEEGQPVSWFGTTSFKHGPYLSFAIQASNRGANDMARRQKLQDGMAPDEARSTGHKHCAHRHLQERWLPDWAVINENWVPL